MSQPTLSEVHVSVPLTNISVNFLQRPDAFLAGRVFPIVPVMKKSDKYFTYTAADFNRTDVAVRAPGVPAPRSGYSVSTDSYNCERRALAHDIADPIRENMDSPLAADQDALAFVMNQMMVDAEIQWAAKYFTTSVWTGSSTGSDITPSVLWDDAASTPVEDVKKEIRSGTRHLRLPAQYLRHGPDPVRQALRQSGRAGPHQACGRTGQSRDCQ